MLSINPIPILLLAGALVPGRAVPSGENCDLEVKFDPVLTMRCAQNDCASICPLRLQTNEGTGVSVYYCEPCNNLDPPDCQTRLRVADGNAVLVCRNIDCGDPCDEITLTDGYETCQCD